MRGHDIPRCQGHGSRQSFGCVANGGLLVKSVKTQLFCIRKMSNVTYPCRTFGKGVLDSRADGQRGRDRFFLGLLLVLPVFVLFVAPGCLPPPTDYCHCYDSKSRCQRCRGCASGPRHGADSRCCDIKERPYHPAVGSSDLSLYVFHFGIKNSLTTRQPGLQIYPYMYFILAFDFSIKNSLTTRQSGHQTYP